MQENLKDILTHLSPDIDQETLMLYLQDKLDAGRKHDVEKHFAENEFASDALEGLVELKDKKQLNHIIELLNRDLKKKVARKKQRRDKLRLPDMSWIYISAIIILLLLVISYVVIHRMRTPG